MKIFVMTRDSIIIYSAVALLLVGILVFGGSVGESILSAASAPREIPIYSVQTDKKQIAITFDAAWGDSDTTQLIDILKKYNARASIFVVGGWTTRFPESTKAFFDAGHEILNHSDSHKHFNALSEEEIIDDIKACEQKIADVTRQPSKAIFRAPYGEYNDHVIASAKKAGVVTVQWDVDTPCKGLRV